MVQIAAELEGARRTILGRIRSALGLRQANVLRFVFYGLVALPVAFAAIYFGFIASDIYVSESRFIVRGVSGQNVGGLASFFRTIGIARAEDDTFAVQNFILSRDAVEQLAAKLPIRAIYSKPEIDPLAQLGGLWPANNTEALFEYYKRRVAVIHNDMTGITTLRVEAFTGQDALDISRALLGMSEALVNRMNARANNDALAHAARILKAAESELIVAHDKLTAFRNSTRIIDPASSMAKAAEAIAKNSAEVIQLRVQLQQYQALSPSSPQVTQFRSRIEALEEQINIERAKLVGTDSAMAAKLAEYERLVLQREFADRALSGALDAVESARQEARRQQIYLETIVRPNLPDIAAEPRRLRYIVTVIMVAFALYGVIWLILAGGREHAHG